MAELEKIDPERWANRRDPLDLPYSYVIHAPDDANGVESSHAHVIVPAFT